MTGIFEGEGSITHGGRSNRPNLSVEMTDEDIINRFHTIAGCGSVTSRVRPPHKPTYAWRAGSADAVVNMLERMLPLLGERRAAKAKNALDFYGCNNDCLEPEQESLG